MPISVGAGCRATHAVHLSSLVLFIAATVHGFASGADRANLAVQWAALTGGVVVVFLAAFRLAGPRRAARAAAASSRPERVAA